MEGIPANQYIRQLASTNCQCCKRSNKRKSRPIVQGCFHFKKHQQQQKVMSCSLITIVFIALLQKNVRAEVAKGGCMCAVFDEDGKEPLVEHPLPFELPCNEDGDADKCMQLCRALAETTKGKAPALLCEKLNKHVENLNVSVHSKSCNNDWKFTGLKSSEAICCHEGKDTSCNITEALN